MKLQEFVAQSADLVNELSRAIENKDLGLKEVEEKIQRFLNRIGDLMLQDGVTAVQYLIDIRDRSCLHAASDVRFGGGRRYQLPETLCPPGRTVKGGDCKRRGL